MKRTVAVEMWIKSINKSHAELVDDGLDPSLRIIRLYPGGEEFFIEPEPGVSYEFDSNTKLLRTVAVTFIRRVEQAPEFKEVLSEPYGCADKSTVRNVWGSPFRAREPLVMPEPLGKTGGWDMYRLTSQGFGQVEIIYSYTTGFVVSGIVLRASEDDA